MSLFRKEVPFLAIYKDTFYRIVNTPVAAQCDNRKPLTAALLFLIADLTIARAGNEKLRQTESKMVFSFLEKDCLNPSELKVFDASIDLFAGIVRGNIAPRGDWCYYNETEGWLSSLFVCYGDLMRYPEYLYEYQSAPIMIISASDRFDFMRAFMELREPVTEYTKKIINLY